MLVCLYVCRYVSRYVYTYAGMISPAFSQSSCRAENSDGDVCSCGGNKLRLLQIYAVAICHVFVSAGGIWLYAQRFAKR